MDSSRKILNILAISTLLLAITVECQVIRQGCREKCGNVTIPYPFGIGEGCALNANFTIVCNDTIEDGPKPFLPRSSGALDIIDISLNGHLRKHTYVARDCYEQTGERHTNRAFSTLSEFFYSSTRNKFTAVGCDTYARLLGSADHELYGSGCISVCYNKSSVTDGSCSGIGCCQASIPKQLSKFRATLQSYANHTYVWDFNPCSYAFIADVNFFNFSSNLLQKMPRKVPTVLDWAIGDQSCADAVKNTTTYACKDHSNCRESDNGPGYLCSCSSGYRGNPYIDHGCVDVNECEEDRNDCTHKCHNTEGSYMCSCPKWFHGDGRRNGVGCLLSVPSIKQLRLLFYLAITLFV